MKSGDKIKKKLQSISFKFSAALFIILLVLLIALNLFTFSSPRDALYAEIEGELLNSAKQLSVSLANAETFDKNSIRNAVEALGLEETYQVIVTDLWGVKLYSSLGPEINPPRAVVSDLIIALSGETTYSFSYKGAAYDYDLSMPITNNGNRLGALCLFCHDTARGGTFDLTLNNLKKMTILLGVLAAFAIFAVTRSLSRRIRDLNSAIRSARSGDYAQRVSMRGNDEITELSAEFNQLMERLQKTEKVRRRFVADASHELKTPLSVITLMSDSIMQNADMPQQMLHEFVSDIRDEAVRLKRITEKLLVLTKLDAGKASEQTFVDLKKAAENAVHTLTPLAERSHVSLRLEAPEETFVVSASEDDVFQIIFNLAENAIKYNRRGGSSLLRLTADENEICLLVEDTGIGIPEADIPQIFSRFYRVDKQRSRETGGSGLGLSIVRDTLKRLGGRIEVSSKENEGTRFTVFFPRHSL
jgi:signal transduction histidine kinase